MDPFVGYAAIQSQQHFWQELDEVLDGALQDHPDQAEATRRSSNASHIAISSALQRFLALTDACYDRYLDQEYNRNYTVKRLLDSAIFSRAHEDYASECVVEQLRSATSLRKVLICYDIILLYGQRQPAVYRLIQGRIKDILFRLVHQIWAGFYATQAEERIAAEEEAESRGKSKIGQSLHFEYARLAASEASGSRARDAATQQPGWNGAEWEGHAAQTHPALRATQPAVPAGLIPAEGSSASVMRQLQISLRSKAVRMMYEVCRVQKLEPVEMRPLDQKFLNHLFDLVEQTREHDDDSFNYQLIKLIVAINEQYMVAGFADGSPTPVKNTVLEVFRTRLNVSKTFGENLIFMLNRASSDAEDICMQLLVLKLLYLLFTTEDTAHYFYTNDLKVLVDVFIRELSDLPEESESLRHTYLRVLHPLLTNTQLCTVPYKRPQIRRLLLALISLQHIRDVSATTKRLVDRCLRAEWCVALDQLTQGTPQAGPGVLGVSDALGVAVAKVESVGGADGSVIKAIHTTTTVDGTQILAPVGGANGEGAGVRSGTTLAVAAANVEERTLSVTSAIGDYSSSPLNSLQPSPAVADADKSFDSDISEGLKRQLINSNSVTSLPIPGPRAREKRVSSVSHARPPAFERTKGSTTPSSTLGPHSVSYDVRTAPPTPPRRGSFSRSASGGSHVLTADTDSVSSHSTSASSSWHNNLVEAPPLQPHLKVGSPLAASARNCVRDTNHQRAQTTDGYTNGSSSPPITLPEGALPLPSMHIQDSSDSTIRSGRGVSDMVSSTYASTPTDSTSSLAAPSSADAVPRRIRSHSQLAAASAPDLTSRDSSTPSPSPSAQGARRRPPPPPVAQGSLPLSGTAASPTLTAASAAPGRAYQTLAAPSAIRAPPPINRATKGTRSPAGPATPIGANSPNAQQGSFDRQLRYPSPHYG
ncbi:pre-rRNA processing [Tilletia horrida]|nr:pre-rRNA processing [Tilletia horrida]